jgi:LuxR family maltose regulon positive regulatory protein
MSGSQSQSPSVISDSTTSPLALTKLQRPGLGRGLIARPRLLEQLTPPSGLTLILAPAGYGKTTLLSTWLDTCSVPYAWLSLDTSDDQLSVFVTYVVAALRTIFPEVAENTVALLHGTVIPPAEVIARSLLNDLAALQQDFILVLDDYHVIREQAIHELILELVQHQPRALHLVIASRNEPPLPLARLRARGHMAELRATDLRFTLEETDDFLRHGMALTLGEQTIADLTAKTEGWPAGLRLTALSLRRQQPPTRLIDNVLSNNRYVMDYLLNEVLAQLPISVQEYLIKTSILNRLCGPLGETVTGMTDRMFSGQYVLEWLERADLFLTPIDEQQYWYRCHHLFRQLLLHRLQELLGPAEIAALHLRASTWLAANGYLDEALQHALAAGDTRAAVQMVAQHHHQLINQGLWLQATRWLQMFPLQVIDEQPDLLLIEVWLLFLQQRIHEVPPLLDRIEAVLRQWPPAAAKDLQGEVDARWSAVYFWNGDVKRSMDSAEQALANLPARRWYMRAYAHIFLGLAYVARGDLAQAYATFNFSGEPDQSQPYQDFLTGVTCFVRWVAADLSGLMEAASQVLARTTRSDHTEFVTWSQYHLGLGYYQRNDVSVAEEYLAPLVMRPYASNGFCFLNSAVLLARIRQEQGRAEDAQKIVEAMVSFALELGSARLILYAQTFQAELALRQGRLEEAGQWVAQYGPFSRTPLPYVFAPPVVAVLIWLAQNTPASRQQARQLLSEMDEYFSAIHCSVVRIQVLALQAMLDSAEGDERQALVTLEKAIALAEPGGFLRLFVDLGAVLKPLLTGLAQRDVSPTYINKILAAFGAGAVLSGDGQREASISARLAPPSAVLTNREQEVLALLAKRYTDKEIAGALSISLETVHTHVSRIGDKLEVRGRRAIVEAAQAHGLLG